MALSDWTIQSKQAAALLLNFKRDSPVRRLYSV
jgi:hypothetical protein